VRASLEQTLSFEVVDNRHHRARRYRQVIAHRLLELALGPLDGVQDGKVARLKPERPYDFAELAGSLEADLGERETHGVPGHRHTGLAIY
jgi:hypothetical protein